MSRVRFISTTEAHKLLVRGCEGFMCSVVDTEMSGPSLWDILVVQEVSDVYLEEILDIPTPIEVEFYIDLVLGATPISRAPYQMTPLELKELKSQLDELLEKGYIRPSTSPWGAQYCS